MRTSYVTDYFSSLAGLATVAYSNPEFFREVKNQIYADSETFFIDQNRPSATLEDLFINEFYLKRILKSGTNTLQEGSASYEFLLSILGEDWKDNFVSDVFYFLKTNIDSSSEYFYTPSTYLEVSVLSVINKYLTKIVNIINDENFIKLVYDELVKNLISAFENDKITGVDSLLFFRMINNNPQTKISKVKPDSIISLNNQVELGQDYRGIEFELGYLTVDDYLNNIAYPNTQLS